LQRNFTPVKKTAALILLLVFLLHTFHTGILTCWFNQNRQWVAAELCVNKSRPAMKCNGKCFLSKKIKAVEEQQENGCASSGKHTEETMPFVLLADDATQISSPALINSYPSLAVHYHFLYSNSHFHPPGCTG
jgi:hypothetical protein